MSTQKAVSTNPERNNGGTVLNGGNIDGSNVTNTQGFDIFAADLVKNNSFVQQDGTHLTAGKAVNAGTFGVLTEGAYLIPQVTSSLAGVANTSFQTTGADFPGRRSIHFKERARFGYVTNFDRSLGSGVAIAANYLYTDILSKGEGAIDDAAHPTRAIPGEFVYFDSGPGVDSTATEADYPPKTL